MPSLKLCVSTPATANLTANTFMSGRTLLNGMSQPRAPVWYPAVFLTLLVTTSWVRSKFAQFHQMLVARVPMILKRFTSTAVCLIDNPAAGPLAFFLVPRNFMPMRLNMSVSAMSVPPPMINSCPAIGQNFVVNVSDTCLLRATVGAALLVPIGAQMPAACAAP